MKWKAAIEAEKKCLDETKTWKLVPEEYASGKILTSRWVFKKKEDGRYRARLVAKGCQQMKSSFDFMDTYSAVVRTTSIRTFLAIGAMKNLNFQTFDIKSAFLYGDLEEEIFMKLSEGYNHPGMVCLLQKALYGLRQAPLQWYKKLTIFLKNELKSDKCVFKIGKGKQTLYLAIHVDDGLILGEDESEIQKLLQKMGKQFKMTTTTNPKVLSWDGNK